MTEPETARVVDLVIVGGGITGLGLFERAAREGLSCLLLERGRPGGATTAVTSALFHGGLRYLPYDVSTAYRMCREIRRLREERPELMIRQPFVWPVYRGRGPGLAAIGALLDYYDAFAGLRGAKAHSRLSAEETLRALPGLSGEGLLGGYAFEEWRADVPALVERLLQDAASAGGRCLSGRRVVGFERGPDGLTAAVTAGPAGIRETFQGRLFVNAAGPWSEEVAALAGARAPLRLRAGAHWIVEGPPPPAAVLFEGPGGRIIGLYPREGESWVGPTDSDYGGNLQAPAPEPGEGPRLREALERVLPGWGGRPGRLVMGLRPLFAQRGVGNVLSRDHRVIDHAAQGTRNLVTVMGGKLTTFAPVAGDAMRVIAGKLGLEPRRDDGEKAGSWPLGTHSRALSLALSGGLLAYFALRRAAGFSREAVGV